MATVTHVTDINSGGNRYAVYDIGAAVWASPALRTFDSRGSRSVNNDQIIDILILGDGYLAGEEAQFTAEADAFYDDVLGWPATNQPGIWPYNQFSSVFRVRAMFVASSTHCDGSPTGAPNTFYGLEVDADGVAAGMPAKPAYQTALFDTIDLLTSRIALNLRQYPANLLTNWSGDDPDTESLARCGMSRLLYRNLARNLVVVHLVRRGDGGSLSGYAPAVRPPAGHALGNLVLRVGIGQNAVHEFCHAFAYLGDEYIRNANRGKSHLDHVPADGSTPRVRFDPGVLSIFTLYNVSFSHRGDLVAWRHLAWDQQPGWSGPSWVGQQWLGGKYFEEGAWHCEYKCLMNGGHGNYFHRTDEGLAQRAGLRIGDRLCLWCEEIVTIRILEKTDSLVRPDLGESTATGDFNELGRAWHQRWVDQQRAVYWREFNIANRMADREAWYRNPANLTWPRTPGHADGPPGSVFDGRLEGTNLMKEITKVPEGDGKLLELH